MKFKLLLPFILIVNSVFAQFQLGDNVGYYGQQYDTAGHEDQPLYRLMLRTGGTSTRSTYFLQQYVNYPKGTFTTRTNYPATALGMTNNTFFLAFPTFGGTYTGQDTTHTANGNRTWLPAGLKNNPFNPDSSINSANLWAMYCADVATSVGANYTNYEIGNEPDFTFSSNAYTPASQPGYATTSWQTNEPVPNDLPNMNDSLERYVLLCKVANQVIKHIRPTAKIFTGGLGYAWFFQWFLRKGGGQWVDGISFHAYPFYYSCYCVWNGANCSGNALDSGRHRHSDFVAHLADSLMNSFRIIETNESQTHLPMITTETAIGRWSNPGNSSALAFPNNKQYGSSAYQRNFYMKSTLKMMQDTLKILYLYALGEFADSGQVSGTDMLGQAINYFSGMGAYKNLEKATELTATQTPEGTAELTMHNLLHNYTINHTPISFLVAGTDGVELDSSVNKIYVVWAKTTIDTVESASGTVNLPAGQSYTGYDPNQNNLGTFTGSTAVNANPIIFIQQPGATAPPTVSAGANQNITTTSTSVTGTASAGSGSITSTVWTQVSGAAATIATPNSLTTNITGLTTGTYVFKLTATQTGGLSSSSNITITVTITPLPPTAVATANPTSIVLPVDSVDLIGTGSFDPNNGGFISSYSWTKVSGRGGDIIRNPTSGTTYVVFDSVGTYVYQLIVKNNNNLTASTTVTVIVNQTLKNPVAVINANNIINLPLNIVQLNGTASRDSNQNSSIIVYNWQLISWPTGSPAIISNASQSIAQLGIVIPGTYVVSLTVTDTNNLQGTTQGVITVNANYIITVSQKVVKVTGH
jgi:hypothetical protein